ncbi:hypothetical protein [Pedobacter sp. WC2423]|uniref:hypothetical protein n=1 Tax=Pedobacter sp. WC2423 TaxID=3234142 RepID=UPI0034656CF7
MNKSVKKILLLAFVFLNFYSCKKSESDNLEIKNNTEESASLDSLKALMMSKATHSRSYLDKIDSSNVQVTVNDYYVPEPFPSNVPEVYPLNGGDLGYAHIRGYYANIKTGVGYTGGVSNLGVILSIREGNVQEYTRVPAVLPTTCWQVGRASNSASASALFVLAYNLAVDELKLAVQRNPAPFYISYNVQQTLVNLVRANLSVVGGSFSMGTCSGITVPYQPAVFGRLT